ncbi:MAG TPA: TonB-dependent receptor [Steroidobacteraceae bacterium]|jgi:iron complex outermembrane receptor protein|nr:TonB-dependent receptor [Steroidobacteraceae bacterium]
MKKNHKITCAILAALSAHAGVSYAADAADAATATDSDALQEVTVTATRRSESIQNVPITIQALTGDQLQSLGIASFSDIVKYLPNVSFGGSGPGQGEIYMRGLSAGGPAGSQSSASFLNFPNVGVYLDDQSVQFPGRNLDIYMADMSRVEVLEGPQGTLFGGGAEAGAVRYITNKPLLDKTEASVSAMYGVTAHGDPNQSMQAMLNVPLIDGVFALRGVIYDERRGGYIDNVPSTFTRSNNDPGTAQEGYTGGSVPGYTAVSACPNGQPPSSGGYCVPPYDVQANNFGLARAAQNPTTYGGIRVEALWQVTDDWSALLSQSYQNMDAEGSDAQYLYGSDYGTGASTLPSSTQPLGPWQGTFFTPIWDKDKWENTALTVNGKVADLSLVYSGAYLVRHIDTAGDYTNYSRSGSGYYYNCSGAGNTGFNPGGAPQCYNPVLAWQDTTRNSHISNELRLTTPDDWRLRGLFGLYQENFTIADDMNFQYNNLPTCTATNLAGFEANAAAGLPNAACSGSIGPVPSSSDVDPNPRASGVTYGEDERRGYSQYAAFTSLDFDLLPKVLTLTAGTRYYHYNEYEFGTRYLGNCYNQINCGYNGGNIIDPTDPGAQAGGSSYPDHQAPFYPFASDYHGFRSRANLTWHIAPDAMVYYTWSQGFRPGGFNRFSRLHFGNVPECTLGTTVTYLVDPATGACANGGTLSKGPYQFQNPYSYAPDTLVNNEIGWKTSWFDHRLQLDGSAYIMDWKNAQFVFFDPSDGFGASNFITNGPNYQVKGVELQLLARPITGVTLQASSSWNSSNQTNDPCLLVNNPALTSLYGSCITQTDHGGLHYIDHPLGELDSRPAMSPPLQFSLQARYDWVLIKDYRAWISAGASHTAHMSNQPAGYPAPTTPASSVREFFDQPGYTTYDASLGVAKDAWTVTLFGQNLSNSDASTFTSSAQYIEMQTPLRPRVLGLRVDYKF